VSLVYVRVAFAFAAAASERAQQTTAAKQPPGEAAYGSGGVAKFVWPCTRYVGDRRDGTRRTRTVAIIRSTSWLLSARAHTTSTRTDAECCDHSRFD